MLCSCGRPVWLSGVNQGRRVKSEGFQGGHSTQGLGSS